MRAVVLAAGVSQRLSPLNLGIPKPMIKVHGKPLIEHHLETCVRLNIKEVFINLYYLPQKIRGWVGDGSKWGLQVAYHLETELLGTGGAVRHFKEKLEGDDVLVLYGDNYCDFSVSECLAQHMLEEKKPDMSIVLFEKEDTAQSGVAVMDQQSFIKSFIEKPAPGTSSSHWVNAGVYLLSPKLLNEIPEGKSDFGKDLIPQFIQSGRKILGIKTAGTVIAVDTPELYQQSAEKD
jgi:NDP-sugar pyrophosphorylase family protein